MANQFNEEAFKKLLLTRDIGRQLIYCDVTGSTMDDAREMAINHTQKYPHGTVVMAERQTKARGARDHKWDASNSGNIYISIILHLPQKFTSFEGRFELEVIACLAVMRVARKFGAIEAIPKWPNDVWARGHKLAGNLVEDSRFNIPGTPLCLLILGMGINVNADVRRNGELYSIATSILCERQGQPSEREAFLADVCLALEENLALPQSDILQVFRDENLFQKGCDLSITCPSEGKVINGEFLQICDNWEVSFTDKRTQTVMHGRSDFYTIRPKVMRKILVVFTGVNGNQTASVLSRWLSSLVDSSKQVVCLVPESSVIGSDDWMKTCDLLALVEGICDANHMTPKLKMYLNHGGRIFASGSAASFVAKLMEIPLKERVLESSVSSVGVSLVYLECSPSIKEESTDTIAFLATPTCLKFSQKYLESGCLSGTSTPAIISSVQAKISSPSLKDVKTEQKAEKCVDPPIKDSFLLYYSSDEDTDFNVAAFMRPTTSSGSLTLFGFDIGAGFPSSTARSALDNQGLDQSKSSNTRVRAESEVNRLHEDRFLRDEILLKVVKSICP